MTDAYARHVDDGAPAFDEDAFDEAYVARTIASTRSRTEMASESAGSSAEAI